MTVVKVRFKLLIHFEMNSELYHNQKNPKTQGVTTLTKNVKELHFRHKESPELHTLCLPHHDDFLFSLGEVGV